MISFKKYIYPILLIFLTTLLISGYLLNKKSSASKKMKFQIFLVNLKQEIHNYQYYKKIYF